MLSTDANLGLGQGPRILVSCCFLPVQLNQHSVLILASLGLNHLQLGWTALDRLSLVAALLLQQQQMFSVGQGTTEPFFVSTFWRPETNQESELTIDNSISRSMEPRPLRVLVCYFFNISGTFERRRSHENWLCTSGTRCMTGHICERHSTFSASREFAPSC